MKVETAVILAAGRGMRLKELGEQAPKGFLRLGQLPIIEESLLRLKGAGICRVVIVTGHLAVFYDDLAERYRGFVSTVHNPHYASSGSMYSLFLAREVVGDVPFLLLESDLTYERRALAAVQEPEEEDVLLVSGNTFSGDEVYVEANGGRLINLSKNRAALGPSILGELVGITRISPALYRAMLDAAEVAFRSSLNLEYEQALVIASTVRPVHCHLVPDLLWSEIDDTQHLERALHAVYPRIVERDGTMGE